MAADSPFGAMLKRRRKALDLTQEELAWRVGCAVETLRKLEQGKRRPSRELAMRLAQELAVPEAERAAFVRLGRTDGGAPALQGSLSAPLTPLVGRARELAEVTGLLRDASVRLLSVIGAPGIGKTRLCLQAAAEARSHFPDGAYFVGLAPISDPPLLIPALAQALSLGERLDRPLSSVLKDHLRDKRLLLTLDTFEHLLAAAPLVSELLASAPGLTVLVSSRTPLKLYGERAYQVPPLEFPPSGETPSPAALAGYGAVALFVQRAQAVQHDFSLTPENAPAITDICRKLDGLPLALELAATRIKLFSAQVLAARLDMRLAVLVGGASDLPERQRTLRGTIAWSYDLLDEPSQALFRRLGVFVDSFTLAAAAAVVGDLGEAAPQVVGGVAALLDQSLLQRLPGADAEARFGMLETIREYACEHLLEREAEHAQAARAHSAWCLGLLREARAPQSRAALERLEREDANLRAAWRHAAKSANFEALAASAEPLRAFLAMRGRLQEGFDLFGDALTLLGNPESQLGRQVTGRLLICKAWFTSRLGRLDDAHALAQAGVAALEAIQSRDSQHDAQNRDIPHGRAVLGYVAKFQGDYPRATQELAAALKLARAHGDRAVMAECLADLANTRQLLGDYSSAQHYAEAALLVYQEQGDQAGVVWSHAYLGLVHLRSGALEKAAASLARARRLAEASGERLWLALALAQSGLLAQAQNDLRHAEQRLLEALEIARESGEAGLQAWLWSDLGRLELALGRQDAAAQHFQQALALATTLHWPGPSLSALVGFALCYRDDPAKAAPLAGLVYRHPATEHVHREMARELLSAQGAPLPAELRSVGSTSGFDEAIRGLLMPDVGTL